MEADVGFGVWGLEAADAVREAEGADAEVGDPVEAVGALARLAECVVDGLEVRPVLHLAGDEGAPGAHRGAEPLHAALRVGPGEGIGDSWEMGFPLGVDLGVCGVAEPPAVKFLVAAALDGGEGLGPEGARGLGGSTGRQG